jgi:hypothetical protein
MEKWKQILIDEWKDISQESLIDECLDRSFELGLGSASNRERKEYDVLVNLLKGRANAETEYTRGWNDAIAAERGE